MDETQGELQRTKQRRQFALAAAGLGTAFWLYTFYAIAQVPTKDGSGFQWLAVMPLGAIFVVFTLPALIMALAGRALKVSLVMGIVGLILFGLLWNELAGELRIYR